MNKNSKLYAVISYITWIGWLIAYFKRDKDDELVKLHLNQAFILNVVGLISNIVYRAGGVLGTICTIVDLAILVLSIMGIVRAAKESMEPLPVIGDYKVIK